MSDESPEKCVASCNDGSSCNAYPLTGRDKCRMHAGTSSDGSSHEGNDNAAGNSGGAAPPGNVNRSTHGMYVETNAFYQKVATDDEQALIDAIFQDYIDDYRELHGESSTGTEAELFRIAVSYGKHVHAGNWAVEKPDELDSGNATVDREAHYTEEGTKYYRYKETVVAKGQARLSRDRRSWLKDLGLMDSPEDRQADALEDGIDLTLTAEEKQGLDETFDVEPQT